MHCSARGLENVLFACICKHFFRDWKTNDLKCFECKQQRCVHVQSVRLFLSEVWSVCAGHAHESTAQGDKYFIGLERLNTFTFFFCDIHSGDLGRYSNGQHGLQPRPRTLGPPHPSQFSLTFYIGLPNDLYNTESSWICRQKPYDHTNNKLIIIFPKQCLNCERSRLRKALRPQSCVSPGPRKDLKRHWWWQELWKFYGIKNFDIIKTKQTNYIVIYMVIVI